MRPSNILVLYRVRLRTRIVQELFAVVGIAVGVALLFASQIASTSLDGSVRQLTRGIVGEMSFQLAARGPEGFDARLLGEVQRLPDVRAAAPVLEQHINVIGPTGRRSVDLIGTDPHFAHLGGPLLRHFTAAQLADQQAFALPVPIARSIGLLSLQSVNLQIGDRVVQGFLGTELLESDIGALVDSPVAVAPLAYAQHLTGMPGRVSRIFLRSYPGRDREVQAELSRLAAGRLNVRPADFDATLFGQAAGPANQSALLFSAISALVGFLFAFNAILLTVPQRRRLVEDLRLDGYPRRAIIEVLLLDALVLGISASLLGLILGDLLSLAVFRTNPGYLSFAFPVGSQRIVTWQSAVIAVGGGLLASCVGVLTPLRWDIFSRLSLGDAERRSNQMWTVGAPAGGLVCLAITTVILIAAPQAAIAGVVVLVLAMLILLPSLVAAIMHVFDCLQQRAMGATAYLALVELRMRANRARSLAIAATGAIAVFGSVAIEGAHRNLQSGLDRAAADLNLVTDIWVSPAGAAGTLATMPFQNRLGGALAHLPGIRSVSLYRGSFLDVGDHRALIVAPPRSDVQPIPASQLAYGNLSEATARIRAHGWVTVSRTFADKYNLEVGKPFTLPSPRPIRLRVAAITTNFGWPPGAIVLNADDYARAWGSSDPSAYLVALKPGVSPAHGQREIEHALSPGSALAVQTARQREENDRATQRQGLSRLTQIATLVLIAAVLAMAAAMGAMIWQRRARLADLKVDGFSAGLLWRALICESGLLLGAGCSAGAVFGLYGQLLLSHALATVTGFPVAFSVGALVAAASLVLVTTVAVLIIAVPGYLATRIRPAIALQD
jgi:putative ABC transport system permease protein